jgi:hypothetical protein
VVTFLALCAQRQAAAVCVFLCFFGFGVLAFEIGECHVERFVTEPDANRVYRNAFFVQRVSIGLAVAVKLGASTLAFFAIAFSLRRKCPSAFPFPFGNGRS